MDRGSWGNQISKKKLLVSFIVALSGCIFLLLIDIPPAQTQSQPQTTISGTISSDTTWTPAGNPYVLNGEVTVAAGHTLTIEPGVVVKGLNVNSSLIVEGDLQADGAIFTSYKDDSQGGDTNGDGAATMPAPGNWNRIYFNNGSGYLSHCTVMYGGSFSGEVSISGSSANVAISQSGVSKSASDGIYLSSTSPNLAITESNIDENGSNGLYSYYSLVNVWGNSFNGNTSAAISVPAVISGGVHSNDYIDNGINAMHLTGNVTASTTWPASNSPYVLDGPPQGSGGMKWTRVQNGGALTIEPGTVVKFYAGPDHTDNFRSLVVVSGSLNADGAVFTSFFDDSHGGDSNGDGSGSAPQPGDWQQIYFQGGGGSISSSTVTYGGSSTYGSGSMVHASAFASITDTEVSNSKGPGIAVGAHGASINGCTIRANGGDGVSSSTSLSSLSFNTYENNAGTAVIMPGIAGPGVNNNSYTGNGMDGMFLSEDIVQDTTWAASNTPYVVQGLHGGSIGNKWLEVAAGATLTIEPGATVKFYIRPEGVSHNRDNRLLVSGGLVADGVIFTSFNDDTAVGDTNGDGNDTAPAPGDWRGIDYQSSLLASSLGGSTVKYGGGFTSYMISVSSGAAPIISGATIELSASGGIVSSGNPAITDTVVRNNGGDGLNASTLLTEVTGNSFTDNTGIAVKAPGIETNVFDNTYADNGMNGMYLYGDIAQDTTWAASNTPYVIQGLHGGSIGNQWMEVAAGATLTIESGATVKFYKRPDGESHNTDNKLWAFGGLVADGVTFTSIRDDSADGDTNGDGSASTPQPGDWREIAFSSSQTSSLSGSEVRYGGSYSSSQVSASNGSSPAISGSTIEASSSGGIGISNGDPAIVGNIIHNNGAYGLYSATPLSSVSGNTFSDNDDVAARLPATIGSGTYGNVLSGNRFNAMHLTGDVTAPTIWPQSSSPYVVENAAEINAPLTIESGSVVKLAVGLNVYSDLSASNTVFTSVKDDSVGGDTNGDGSATAPAPGDWTYIGYRSSAMGDSSGSIDGCTILYGGGGGEELLIESSPSINNSIIGSSSSSGIYVSSGEPSITNNTITNNTVYGLNSQVPLSHLSGNAFVSNNGVAVRLPANIGEYVSNNGYSGNLHNGMYLFGDVTSRSDWQASNSPYVLLNTVDVNAPLDIRPGAVIKFGDPVDSFEQNIVVNSTLAANGAIFTSYQDDSYDGDTNGDGTATSASQGDWNMIHYTSGSGGYLTGCVVRFGGGSSPGQLKINSSPLIEGNAVSYSLSSGIVVSGDIQAINHNDIFQNNRACPTNLISPT